MADAKTVVAQLSSLLIPGATPITWPALVFGVIEYYNTLFPEYPIYRTLSEQPKQRRVNERSDCSALFSKVLQQDPSGVTLLMMLLPELQKLRAQCTLKLTPESAPSMLISLEKAINLSAWIVQIQHSPQYAQYLQACHEIYQGAAHIIPGLTSHLSADDFCRDHAYRAHQLSGELQNMKQLQLSPPSEGVDHVAPAHLNDWIVRVDNEAELLEACALAPAGFTLCATLPEQDLASSYFSLICRSASRTVLIQDILQPAYPGQSVSRRNERRHAQRIEKSPFPYRLLDLSFSNDLRTVCKERSLTDLSTKTPDGLKTIASVRDMSADELLDLLICLRLLMADWKSLAPDTLTQPEQALLSFRQPDEPLPAVFNQTPLTVPVEQLTLHGLTTDVYAALETRYGNAAPEPNWVVEQILPELLATLEDRPLLQATGSALTFASPVSGQPTAINSADGVLSDLLYLARQAQADIVLQAFAAWQTQQRPLMQTFLNEHMLSHKEIISQLIDTRCWEGMRPHDTGGLYVTRRVALPEEQVEFYLERAYLLGFSNPLLEQDGAQDQALLRSTYNICRYDMKISLLSAQSPQWRDDFIHGGRCPISGEPAEIFIEIRLWGVHAVSAFTGVNARSLPPLLRTLGMEPYHGNAVLSRLDPLMHENALRSRQPYSVFLGLSLGAFHQLRNDAGFAPLSVMELKKRLGKI